MTVPLKRSRANKYAYVSLCPGREYRTVCGVCAYGARVVHHFLIEGIHRHRNLLFQLDVHWNVPGWYECSTQNKPRKQVCTRISVPCACLAHNLQCLRVRGACCPSLLKQLVIWVVVERTHRHRNLLFQLDVHWNVPGWYECSTENKPCKQVCARTPVS